MRKRVSVFVCMHLERHEVEKLSRLLQCRDAAVWVHIRVCNWQAVDVLSGVFGIHADRGCGTALSASTSPRFTSTRLLFSVLHHRGSASASMCIMSRPQEVETVLNDTGYSRDLPVLTAIAEKLERSSTPVDTEQLIDELGLTRQDLTAALRALDA
jgi:hypothetical protein